MKLAGIGEKVLVGPKTVCFMFRKAEHMCKLFRAGQRPAFRHRGEPREGSFTTGQTAGVGSPEARTELKSLTHLHAPFISVVNN